MLRLSIYLGALLAIAYRYSYLVLAPEPVEMPALNPEQMSFIVQQGYHKWVYFSISSALHLLSFGIVWKMSPRSLKKPAMHLCGLLTMYTINDVFFGGKFSLFDQVATIAYFVVSTYTIGKHLIKLSKHAAEK